MNKPLDELYFVWLYGQVGSVNEKNPSRSYWRLLKLLHNKEFVWLIPNDDNRAADGCDLRREFCSQEGIYNVDPNWMGLGCSMFELLIAMSRRLAFQDDGTPDRWFWCLIENLELEVYNDNTRPADRKIGHILDRVIWRTYRKNGVGGLFPLKQAREDQREVELWYQMSNYLLENSF